MFIVRWPPHKQWQDRPQQSGTPANPAVPRHKTWSRNAGEARMGHSCNDQWFFGQVHPAKNQHAWFARQTKNSPLVWPSPFC